MLCPKLLWKPFTGPSCWEQDLFLSAVEYTPIMRVKKQIIPSNGLREKKKRILQSTARYVYMKKQTQVQGHVNSRNMINRQLGLKWISCVRALISHWFHIYFKWKSYLFTWFSKKQFMNFEIIPSALNIKLQVPSWEFHLKYSHLKVTRVFFPHEIHMIFISNSCETQLSV